MGEALSRKALRLVLVRTEGEGSDLVSLALRSVLASCEDDGMTAGAEVPVVRIGEEEEREARRMAGLPPEGQGVPPWGWPGWEVIFTWLEAKSAANPEERNV
jgi:hypothetical protein